ncbi:MAG: prolipoprotein diacylglyceryl transferase [Porcipelethomonas sp.]
MTVTERLDPDQIVFPKLGIDINIDNTAFTIFGLEIKWYGLIITIGMLLAMIYGFSQMKKYGIDPDRAIDAVIGGIIGGLVGARVYYVVMKWEDYADDWISVFNIRKGGLAIYGGIIGAILIGGIIARIRKVKLLPLLDVVSIGFLLGQGIGRWGNFVNQEAFGYNTDNIFGMSGGKIQEWIMDSSSNMASSSDIIEMSWQKTVHPCFLYESFWCLLGFVMLAVFAKKIRRFDGQIFLIYIGWYGIGRFFIEGLRTDSLKIGSLRVSQALSAVCVIASVILLITISMKVKRMGDEYVLYCNTYESKKLIRESEEKYTKKEKSESEEEFCEDDEETFDNASESIEKDENESDEESDEFGNNLTENFDENEGE